MFCFLNSVTDSVSLELTITPISSNAGVQQQRVRLFCKGGDVEGKLVTLGKIVTKGEILVVEGGGVEHNLLAQVEVEEGQGWRHVEPRGGISSCRHE